MNKIIGIAVFILVCLAFLFGATIGSIVAISTIFSPFIIFCGASLLAIIIAKLSFKKSKSNQALAIYFGRENGVVLN